MGRATTAYLLTCAAIGVATGLLIIPATAFSTATYATLPPVSALVAGAWVIGFVVAMRLIERPGAAVLTGLISGLVATPLSTTGPTIVITTVMFAAFIELPFLVTLMVVMTTTAAAECRTQSSQGTVPTELGDLGAIDGPVGGPVNGKITIADSKVSYSL